MTNNPTCIAINEMPIMSDSGANEVQTAPRDIHSPLGDTLQNRDEPPFQITGEQDAGMGVVLLNCAKRPQISRSALWCLRNGFLTRAAFAGTQTTAQLPIVLRAPKPWRRKNMAEVFRSRKSSLYN